MFDGHSKEALKKSVLNLTNQADTTALIHELAAVARALLTEEINKRPDDPKPEETPPEETPPPEAEGEEAQTQGRRRRA